MVSPLPPILNNRIVKGAVSGIADPHPEKTANVDFEYIFHMVLEPFREPRRRTQLAIYISSDNEPTWQNLDKFFKLTLQDFKGPRMLRALSRTTLFDAIRISYMGILWREISIDLVAASLRQCEFSKKITSAEFLDMDSPNALFQANTRYHKFLLLLKRKFSDGKKGTSFVPTLDIDLCWHTHQLYAVTYRKWCIEHLGAAINHDDTVAEGELNNGMRETQEAWLKAYREPYVPDGVRRGSFSMRNIFSRRKSAVVERNFPS